MAVAAKDGSMHHSAGRAKLHDEMSGGAEKKQNSVAPMKKPAGQHEAGGKGPHPAIPPTHQHMAGPHQTPTETPIEDHVSEHGPATHVHHMHDEKTGTHHVTSHHGGMGENMHHSEHESAADAHEHMGKAMDMDNAAENETPDHEAMETEDTENSEEARKMGGIPGLV